ncbi:MAG: hypothetical protein DRI48_09565 [Chloroflexi bacterium]|nr:MAG: hypothetical protein DRI48_09565 [Chloroflexota bacterium]
MGIQVIITRHARDRIRARGADPELENEVRRVVRQAAPFAPRWPEAAAAIFSPGLPVEPVVKYLNNRKAIVTTALPPGVPLKPNTEAVYV